MQQEHALAGLREGDRDGDRSTWIVEDESDQVAAYAEVGAFEGAGRQVKEHVVQLTDDICERIASPG